MINFPAMTEAQRQELIELCEADISCARTLMIAAINVNDDETKAKWESQLLRQQIALAALTAEPVAYMYKDRLHSEPRFSSHTRFGNWSQEDINEYEITETKLYTSPPAPVLRVQDGWIKCSERMPEEHQSTDYVSEEVLVFTSDGKVEISFTDYGRWNCLELVTHWMPLPAPPGASNEQ